MSSGSPELNATLVASVMIVPDGPESMLATPGAKVSTEKFAELSELSFPATSTAKTSKL